MSRWWWVAIGVGSAVGCDGDGSGLFDGIDDGRDTNEPPTGTTETDTGDSTVTTTPGPTGTGGAEQCVVLYGGNDRVRGPDEGLPVEDTPRTLQAWVRTRHHGEQIAVSHGRPSPGQGLQLGTIDGYPLARSGSGNERVTGDLFIADDAWHHLAVAWDGRLAVLIVDGEVVGSGDLSSWTLEGDVVAGNTPTGDLSKSWVGWLDDVRVFRGAREPVDVASDLDGDGIALDALELWWDFEVGEDAGGFGVVVEDLTGNGHDGTTGGTDGSPVFAPCR